MDSEKKKPEVIHQAKTIAVHMYCFNCKSDLQTEVKVENQFNCSSCGSTKVVHEPK